MSKMSEREGFLGSSEELGASHAGGERFHILQPNRDLQSNWEVDLAKNLEEYLLKICSGEISGDQDHVHHSVNFAEAALLLQGSIQVYSRKVEYLYSLVLHALEFISQKRQDPQENASTDPIGESNLVINEENETFLGLHDVPVEAKNCLDVALNKEVTNQFLKPPANLLVLEGDCLDTSGADAGELETYLLATCNYYGDFLLLDPCDAGAVNSFLKTDTRGKEHITPHRGSSIRSKNRQPFSPSLTTRSGGVPHKSSVDKDQDANDNRDDFCTFEINTEQDVPQDCSEHGCEPDYGFSDAKDDSDNDDPWKPLNPHEPGNLKIKPFKRGKRFGEHVIHNTRQNNVVSQFPIAKLEGTISPEFAGILEEQLHSQEKLRASQSPPLYEKLRRSLVFGDQENDDGFGDLKDGNDDNWDDNDLSDLGQAEFDFAHGTNFMETDLPLNHEKHGVSTAACDEAELLPHDNIGTNTSLEDLCQSHLDAFLASIAESEKQTELATRVSSWKQRIECTLKEQETHPPFDIHQYGQQILGQLCLGDSRGSTSFAEVVKGQPKHEVARTFSALLQLVNNGDVELQRSETASEVFTASNPFHIRLIRHRRMVIQSPKSKLKSPSSRKRCSKVTLPVREASLSLKSPQQQNRKVSVELNRSNVIRCTPDGKRRRKSRLTNHVDLQPAK